MKRLNITNGDGAANIIKRCGVPGDVLPWRDPMHHGPFPAGLEQEALSRVRAGYLVGPDGDPTEAERDFQLRDAHVEASSHYDSIILWFEHDLLDQLQILQILDRYSRVDLNSTTLEIICIDRFPGMANFRGIGQLDTDQMASLLDQRQPVTKDVMHLAVAGWAAFRSDDPHDLSAFLKTDLGPLPFLAAALWRHVEEYPSAASGLTRTETQLLSLAANGVTAPDKLFVENMDRETALFIGDWPTYTTLDALCKGGLLCCTPAPFQSPSYTCPNPDQFNKQCLKPTQEGLSVLNGSQDAFGLMTRDQWLGGVHLTSEDTVWTWDAPGKRFMRRAT